ncbi:peptide chain release factor N(5)-glutamine methyltransferase [Staphylococcus saccharolyticus]|uniref:peptide chain release factor N(5)-glutamine methyltransferase n=1 Tax=Staphylococcus saccharolyticus TaxID=33028 RepID=UPI00102DE58E|nr:peptide chain release factor N(5)-glutamine methyltransferase [Staphylococcus saccharolyticus]MBL7574192.1 peptide chain release factor N(5)-glutamine methyltransferase [Staphylococcus saccharolyticus]MBL7585194.1 peptide chain release factor N(5)-glutamine methyltransferase [Staphylococcus saccharolyticus]MBL7639804.1 peptide chain release factor N(5)-glutamine methyltransferase [Staphylococcus saccharolyticus]QRJ68905.1 peptide chain release factor N(5)-glutamine methyltransferase [Staphyl
MVSYREKLEEAIQRTIEKGFEQTRAEWLFLDIFNWSRTDYIIHKHDEMTQTDISKFNLALKRMLSGEPIQYIVGFQSFYGYQFKVNNHCLIPRPETEEVMLYFLNLCSDRQTVADIGTGSGVIAITLKLLKPDLNVYATDLYRDALEVAEENAQYHLQDIHFLEGNALKPLIEKQIKIDGLISNPPYIDKSESVFMDDTVLKYEPHQALFADDKGNAIYIDILKNLPLIMNDGGFIVFEIGYQQGEKLKSIIHHLYPNKQVEVIKDINGNQRIVSLKW